MSEKKIVTPVVSVIMGVYRKDDSAHFDVAISSILAQTLTDLELIVICDGELTMEQEAVLKRQADGDVRIRIYRNEQNRGLAFSMNRAIDLSKGRFIARMDADDISMPERLEKQVRHLEESPDIDLAGTFAYEIDENEEIVFKKKLPIKSGELFRFFAKRDPFIHPSVIFRRDFFRKAGSYDIPSASLGIEDTELWGRAFLRGVKGANLPEFLYRFRAGDALYKRRRGLNNAIDEFNIRCNFIKKGNLPLYYYIYPAAVFIVRLLPPSLIKIMYKYARK